MFMHPVPSQSPSQPFFRVVAVSCWLMVWSSPGLAQDKSPFPKTEVGQWTIEHGRIPEDVQVGNVARDYCFMYQTPEKLADANGLSWVGDPVPLFFSRLTIDDVPTLVISMSKAVFDGAPNGLSVKVTFNSNRLDLHQKQDSPMVLYAMINDEALMDGGGQVLDSPQTISDVDGWLRAANNMNLLVSAGAEKAALLFQFQVGGQSSSTKASNKLNECLEAINALDD